MNMRFLLLGIGLTTLFLSILSWTPVLVISTHSDNRNHFNRAPQIAVDASGNSYVTWFGYDGNDTEIYWVKVDAKGTPGIVQKISTHPDCGDNDGSLPQIAVDASGNSYVTWQGSDGNDYEIYWVKIDTEGTPGTVQKISTHPDCTDNSDWRPQIAVDSSGNSYAAWFGYDGNDTEIYWVKIDSSGTPGIAKKISKHSDNIDYNDSDPQIAVDASGNSYVAWHGCDRKNCWGEPGDLEIYWVKIDSSGTSGMVQKIPPTYPDNINTMDEIARIAVDASGNSYVVWSGMNEKSYDVYWVKIDASETPGTVQKVSIHPDNINRADILPQIAVDSSGTSYITWRGHDGNDKDIYWVKIDSSGTPGAVQKVSTHLEGTIFNDSDPQIAVDASGTSYITWECDTHYFGQYNSEIYWVKIDSSGTPGIVQKISTHQYSKYSDRNPRIAVDASGNSYVVWEGKDASKNNQVFFTAHLPNVALTITIVVILLVIVVTAVLIIIARSKKKILKLCKRQKT